MLQKLCLFPLYVFVENFENVFEIQRKHEDAKRIVFDCEAISQQKLVVVELAITESGPLTSFNISDSLYSHKGCLAMREVNEVEFAIGSKGMIHLIDKWSSKLE